MDLNILIRTLELHGREARFRAGAPRLCDRGENPGRRPIQRVPIARPFDEKRNGPIRIELLTPSPASGSAPDTIAETDVIVRSTAYNRVALFLTIGAALFLAIWWGRRFLPRQRK